MPKIAYAAVKLSAGSLKIVETANAIIEEYRAQGFDLTLRQLYYQFVARGLIANRDTEYKRLGSIINDARMSGLVDWEAIVDRTRYLRTISAWDSPEEIVGACASQYQEDLWAGQRYRPEVWIEKDALVGVIEDVCRQERVPFFSCRGYTSQSEMWGAAQRMLRHRRAGYTPVVLHLGDHDPSGLDMSRDIRDRIALFTRQELQFERLALNMDQVEASNPPPNPAKITDSRASGYIAEFGHESWELDALEPQMIAGLIRDAINGLRDHAAWRDALREEQHGSTSLAEVAKHWDVVTKFIETAGGDR